MHCAEARDSLRAFYRDFPIAKHKMHLRKYENDRKQIDRHR